MAKKDDLPAMPFYWGEWFKSLDVQSIPRDTRCVWFELLGRMWESTERGYLTINNKSMSDFAKALALGFGSNVDEYLHHERILEENGIFSRRESDGAIYSRFMLKMVEIRKKRQESGSKGGSKTQASAKAPALANCENESESTNEEESAFKEEKENTIINNFNTIWSKYPKRVGKKEALRHFRATVKTGDDLNNIHKALEIYMSSKNVAKGYIQNGSTWFNDWETWIDYTEPIVKTDLQQKYEESLEINEERKKT